MAETSLKNEIETISLHKIPTGKHSFIATVLEKTLEDRVKCLTGVANDLCADPVWAIQLGRRIK